MRRSTSDHARRHMLRHWAPAPHAPAGKRAGSSTSRSTTGLRAPPARSGGLSCRSRGAPGGRRCCGAAPAAWPAARRGARCPQRPRSRRRPGSPSAPRAPARAAAALGPRAPRADCAPQAEPAPATRPGALAADQGAPGTALAQRVLSAMERDAAVGGRPGMCGQVRRIMRPRNACMHQACAGPARSSAPSGARRRRRPSSGCCSRPRP